MTSTVRRRRRPYSVVDMFCGFGGLTLGLESTGAFRTVLGMDVSNDALRTFVLNHSDGRRKPKTIAGDLADLDPYVVRSELRKMRILTGQLDVLVGGPPCEGFSQNHGKALADRGPHDFMKTGGKATQRWYRSRDGKAAARAKHVFRSERDDERNDLFRSMLEVVALVRPRIVLIENVREVLTHQDGAVREEIESFFEASGYWYEIRILNAADYGVPQLRKRAFIVAVRKDLAPIVADRSLLPAPTHRPRRKGDGTSRLLGDLGVYVTTYEAIGDLPPAVRSESAPLSRLALLNGERTQFRRYVRNGTLRPSLHVTRAVGERVLERIRALKPGMKMHVLPARLRTKKFYANAYARLEWGKPANTITKSFNNLGSGKFCHPKSNRGITAREAARLQSFPDSFQFVGETQRAINAMIGSAVPALLARAIGLHFADILDDADKQAKNKARRKKHK